MKNVILVLAVLILGFVLYKVIDANFINPEGAEITAVQDKGEQYEIDIKWAKITCKEIAFGNFEPVELCDTSIVSTDAIKFKSKEIIKLKNVADAIPHGVHPGEGYEPIKIRYVKSPVK